MKQVVVNDTNVFIDLLSVGLLDVFFQLSWEIHTTDFVMSELRREGQKSAVAHFAETGKLHIASFEIDELWRIQNMYRELNSETNVSLTDCSVWYYAKTNHCALLTGDRKLRKVSINDGIEVHGIIYVLDTLLEEEVISCDIAIVKLKELYKINPRLPQDDINRRLRLWEGEIRKEDCH